jgi:hypothetical protein
MNIHNWSVQQAIQDRVRKEDVYAWSQRKENRYLPKYEKPQKVQFTAGIYNFIRQVLNDLRP